jgi:hypothetical protein
MEKQISLISTHPFIRHFVFSVIHSLRGEKYGVYDRIVVNTDMVPRASESMPIKKSSILIASPELVEHAPILPVKLEEPPKPDPSMVPKVFRPPKIKSRPSRPPVMPSMPKRQIPAGPPVADRGFSTEVDGYSKITPLLDDPSVSTIECLGKGKDLMVVRAGQKQRTRVRLTDEDIQNILDRVASTAHIPLTEGVFRASIENYSISAVVSNSVGSKFVIKKFNTYDML